MNSGFFATADGVKVIEFNARFGDPECMNIMSLFEGSWPAVMERLASGSLADGDVRLRDEASVVLYLVSPDYALRPGPRAATSRWSASASSRWARASSSPLRCRSTVTATGRSALRGRWRSRAQQRPSSRRASASSRAPPACPSWSGVATSATSRYLNGLARLLALRLASRPSLQG